MRVLTDADFQPITLSWLLTRKIDCWANGWCRQKSTLRTIRLTVDNAAREIHIMNMQVYDVTGQIFSIEGLQKKNIFSLERVKSSHCMCQSVKYRIVSSGLLFISILKVTSLFHLLPWSLSVWSWTVIAAMLSMLGVVFWHPHWLQHCHWLSQYQCQLLQISLSVRLVNISHCT